MRHHFIRTFAALVTATLLSAALVPLAYGATPTRTAASANAAASADSNTPTGMAVSVSDDSVSVSINRVGKSSSGTAKVIRMNSNQYRKGDSVHGIASTGTEGTVIGSYKLGSANKTITTNRYSKYGRDYLYSKYYLVKSGKIIAGPYYATSISAPRASITVKTTSKKGVFNEDVAKIDDAKDLGVQHTCLNIVASQILCPNEDENGKAISYAGRSDVIPFESNGTTYYFNAEKVENYDRYISQYTKAGIDVQAIIIARCPDNWSQYPRSLSYLDNPKSQSTIGFNTSNGKGRDYFIALMEFLASRYSQSSDTGYVSDYVIGNEIDQAYSWNKISTKKNSSGPEPIGTYMEEYSRALRLANNAVKKYASDITVSVPTTHNWNVNHYEAMANTVQDESSKLHHEGNATRSPNAKNSYRSKQLFDWLAKRSDATGDFDWGIAGHNYCTNLPQSDAGYYDTGMSPEYPGFTVTNNYNTTRFLTITNLDVLQKYLEQSSLKYDDPSGSSHVRNVYLTETGVSSTDIDTSNTGSLSHKQQCAWIAALYYKAAQMDCIKALDYFDLDDSGASKKSGFTPGLKDWNRNNKESYDLYKQLDTGTSFDASNKYLPYIRFEKNGVKYGSPSIYGSGYTKINSWQEALQTTSPSDTNINWSKTWDESAIKRVNTEIPNRTLSLSSSSYKANDSILATATGARTDRVALFKKGDDPASTEPIYWYYVGSTNNGIKHRSGKQYDLRATGEMSKTRWENGDGRLAAGQYKVVLLNSSNDALAEQDFAISDDSMLNTASLSTNKTSYVVGENIITTATAPKDSGCWVGIYDKGEVPQKNGAISTYWYYVDGGYTDSSKTTLQLNASGKPTALQTTTFQQTANHKSGKLGKGEYTVYLLDSNYNQLAKQDITIGEKAPTGLKSASYVLDNDTDGFANGTITVNYDADTDATDCVMYWGDGNGNKLEGYDAFAAFKLDTDATVTKFRMNTNVYIPEGAKQLLAYASNGSTESQQAAASALPDNAAYNFSGEDPIAEFQIVSDIHVYGSKSHDGFTQTNSNFTTMLNDVKTNSPNSTGIFVNGDVADNGRAEDYNKVLSLYTNVFGNPLEPSSSPRLHCSIGNHDWLANQPDNFRTFVGNSNDNVNTPSKVYYDEWVNGYHYIYLGGEKQGLHAWLSEEQLTWFDNLMKKDQKEHPNQPVFVFLHQSMYNTVAGSLPGQNWNGVDDEAAFKKVLKKYSNILLFNGHSHWVLNSESNMYGGSASIPAAFNTASVGYLWTSYDTVATGQFAEGSNGYYVKVYKDKVVLMGRDFIDGKWLPSALYVIQPEGMNVTVKGANTTDNGTTVNRTVKDGGFKISAKSSHGSTIKYTSSNSEIASVSSSGLVLPKKKGTAVITVTAEPTSTTVVNRKSFIVNVPSSGFGTPTKLKKGATTDTTLSLSWKKVPSVDGYQVYDTKTGNQVLAKSTKATLKGLKPSSAHNIKVRAYTTDGDDYRYGDWSSSIKVTTRKSVSQGKKYLAGSKSAKASYKVTSKAKRTVTFIKSAVKKSGKTLTVPSTVKLRDGNTYKVTAVGSKALSKYKHATKATIGKNVAKIGSSVFAGNSRLKTITVATKQLKSKKSVHGCLKKSSVKTVKVKVGSKKTNRTYVKQYKKTFKKAWSGKKVTVK
ncbi:MAG: DUF5722 domain-containing protein [Eggerthellaceae bacterium]|jgi:Icc protein